MYEFWYDYIKPKVSLQCKTINTRNWSCMSFGMITLNQKYHYNVKLCYMNVDSFIIHYKTKDVYEDISNDVKKRSHKSNYEISRSLSKSKNKKVIRLMKVEFSEKIMNEFVGLRRKTYSYLIYDDSENKKAKGTKKCNKMNT